MKEDVPAIVAPRLPLRIRLLAGAYCAVATLVVGGGWNASRAIPFSLVWRQIYGTGDEPSLFAGSVSGQGRSRSLTETPLRARPGGKRPIHRSVVFPSSLKKPGPSHLRGTVCIPEAGSGPFPAALLIHGSGPQSRDGILAGDLFRPQRPKPFALLAKLSDLLCSQGFVVLRYDKRSCANCYPDGPYTAKSFRFRDYQRDAVDALRYLRQLAVVDADRVVLVAHSQGAKTALAMGHQRPSIKGLVLLAPALKPIAPSVLNQLHRIALIRRAMLDFVGYWSYRRELRRLQTCFAQLDMSPSSNSACFANGIGLQALREERQDAQRLLQTLREVDRPTLILVGGADLNIDVPDTLRMLSSANNRHLNVRLIARSGHLLTNLAKGQQSPAFHGDVGRILSHWLSSVRVLHTAADATGSR